MNKLFVVYLNMFCCGTFNIWPVLLLLFLGPLLFLLGFELFVASFGLTTASPRNSTRHRLPKKESDAKLPVGQTLLASLTKPWRTKQPIRNFPLEGCERGHGLETWDTRDFRPPPCSSHAALAPRSAFPGLPSACNKFVHVFQCDFRIPPQMVQAWGS